MVHLRGKRKRVMDRKRRGLVLTRNSRIWRELTRSEWEMAGTSKMSTMTEWVSMTDWSVLLWIRRNLNTSIREKMESWWILNFRPKTYGVHFFDIRLSIYFEWETSISNFLFTFSTLINAIIREMIETFCLYKSYQCIVQLLYFASHVAWIKPLKPIYIFIVIIVKYVIHKIF